MYCRKCGVEIPNDSLFCMKCGAKVLQDEDSMQKKIDNESVGAGNLNEERYLSNDNIGDTSNRTRETLASNYGENYTNKNNFSKDTMSQNNRVALIRILGYFSFILAYICLSFSIIAKSMQSNYFTNFLDEIFFDNLGTIVKLSTRPEIEFVFYLGLLFLVLSSILILLDSLKVSSVINLILSILVAVYGVTSNNFVIFMLLSSILLIVHIIMIYLRHGNRLSLLMVIITSGIAIMNGIALILRMVNGEWLVIYNVFYYTRLNYILYILSYLPILVNDVYLLVTKKIYDIANIDLE